MLSSSGASSMSCAMLMCTRPDRSRLRLVLSAFQSLRVRPSVRQSMAPPPTMLESMLFRLVPNE